MTQERLHLGIVMNRLGVSYAQVGRAVGLARATVYELSMRSHWPVRSDRTVLQERIRDFMRSKGTSEEDLAALFVSRPGPQAVQAAKRRADTRNQGASLMLLPKTSLTPLARKHFRLFGDPFGQLDRSEQYFRDGEFAFVSELLWDCAMSARFVALVGESGSGKTTLVADLEERLAQCPREFAVIRPSVLGMEGNNGHGRVIRSADILHAVIRQLDPGAAVPPALEPRTVLAQQLLTASAKAGNGHLVVIEEAHCLPDTTMKHLKRLHELRAGRRPLLGVLLVAQPELKRRLAEGLLLGSLREVVQRCELVELAPLGAALHDYLNHRAAAAGKKLGELIEPAAVPALQERFTMDHGDEKRDHSYPLAVGNAFTLLLNMAADIGAPVITADLVKLLR